MSGAADSWVSLVVAAAVVLAVLGVALGLYALAEGNRRRQLVRRLEDRGTGGKAAGSGAQEQWINRMAAQGQQMDRLLQNPEETTILLAQAGWRGGQARALFYALQIVLPLVVLAALFPVYFILRAAFDDGMAISLAAILFILALLAPRMVLRSAAKRRRERLTAEVPLFINLLILLFEAGLSTRQALVSLVRDGPQTLPETVKELQPILRQVEAGADLSGLLIDAGRTLTPVPDNPK